MKGPFAARAAPKLFALDRDRFARATQDDFGELVGIDLGEAGIAWALERRFCDARDAGAIVGPPGLEVIVYGIDDSLIVAVREADLPRDLPIALRQLATYSFETKYVVDWRDQSFGEACAAIEELLTRANALLPSFRALLRGERGLRRPSRRRRFAVLRRLAAATVR